MRVAFFSPLNPSRSGISDFSEELLPYICKRADVDIFTSEDRLENSWINDNLDVYKIEQYDIDEIRKQYDLAVFHMGNNYKLHYKIAETFMKYGGILELHDVALHHYLAEETIVRNDNEKYLATMEYCHGRKGKEAARNFLDGRSEPLWEKQSLKYTVNKKFVDRAQAIITHSDFAKQLVKGENWNKKVKTIPLHTVRFYDDFEKEKIESKLQLGIDKELLVFGAFGNLSPNKRIEPILKALYQLKKRNLKFRFCIVGEIRDIDIKKVIKEYDLVDEVVITGFTSIDVFDTYMSACDIAFNLRYPTQGETSASLHRLLGMGKPVLVTDIGAFQEYPDDIVFKVRYDENEIDDIVGHILALTKNGILEEKGKQIVSYAREHYSLEHNADEYVKFFENIVTGNYKDDNMEELLDKIMELQLFKNDQYMNHLADKLFS